MPWLMVATSDSVLAHVLGRVQAMSLSPDESQQPGMFNWCAAAVMADEATGGIRSLRQDRLADC